MIKCEIIRDLLPLYIDDCCSEESRKVVERHIEKCSECRRLHDVMMKEVKVGASEKEENLLEEELLRTGKELIEKQIRRDLIEKAAVVDIPVDFMIIAAVLYIYINGIELSFRDSRLYELGYTFVTVMLCVTGVAAGALFLIRGRKKNDCIASRFLVVLSVVWKIEVLLVFVAFAVLTLLYQI